METTCAICHLDGAPVFACPHSCRVRIHTECLNAWYRVNYVCPVCRRAMPMHWLKGYTRVLRYACTVVYHLISVYIGVVYGLHFPFTPLTNETFHVDWVRIFVQSFLTDCIHDLNVAEGNVHEEYKLYGHFLKSAVLNAVAASAGCLLHNAIIYLVYWVLGIPVGAQ